MLSLFSLLLLVCPILSMSLHNMTTGAGAGVGMLELFEGNDASQNMVCTLTWSQVSHNPLLAVFWSTGILKTAQSATWDFQHFDACENDEARSGVLLLAEYGTMITLYDSPSGDKGDDYTEIKVTGSSLELETKVLENH